jgi:AcrR family transcriptional regulator
MGRWEPGTRERLHSAALRLFAENGYEQTTAADIAAAVGLTERTFFRHFPDKREVLFGSDELLGELIARGVERAPEDASPLDLAAAGVLAAAEFFDDERRSTARVRRQIIDRHPALQERERHKYAQFADAAHRALRDRGVEEPAATLAAESAMVVFRTTVGQWLLEAGSRSWGEIANEMLGSLRQISEVPTRG